MLYREPKLLKVNFRAAMGIPLWVSVLYREPKLLKVAAQSGETCVVIARFSALP